MGLPSFWLTVAVTDRAAVAIWFWANVSSYSNGVTRRPATSAHRQMNAPGTRWNDALPKAPAPWLHVCQSLQLSASATVRLSCRFVGWAKQLTTEPDRDARLDGGE